MKLQPASFAGACAIVTAFSWTICALAVAAFPASMMNMTGRMLHLDASSFSWELSLPGFFVGLAAWTVVAYLGGWLIAVVYNRLLGKASSR